MDCADSMAVMQPPGRDTNVAQLSLSVTAPSAPDATAINLYAGAVVVTAVLLLAAVVLSAAVAAVQGRLAAKRQRSGRGRDNDASSNSDAGPQSMRSLLLTGFAWTRSPGSVAFVYAYTSGIAAQSAAVVAVNPGTSAGYANALTILALLTAVAPLIAGIVGFRRYFRRTFVATQPDLQYVPVPEDSASPSAAAAAAKPPTAFSRGVKWFFEPTCDWRTSCLIDSARGYDLMRHFNLLFASYNSRAPWFLGVEIGWLGIAGGVTSMLTATTGCTAAAWLTFGVYAVHVGLLLYFRPYAVRAEAIGQFVVVTGQAVALLLSGIQASFDRSYKQLASAAQGLATGASAVLSVLTVVTACIVFRNFVRLRLARRKAKAFERQRLRQRKDREARLLHAPLLVPVSIAEAALLPAPPPRSEPTTVFVGPAAIELESILAPATELVEITSGSDSLRTINPLGFSAKARNDDLDSDGLIDEPTAESTSREVDWLDSLLVQPNRRTTWNP
jgi:small-conductance mechanosensitive channel